MGYQCVCPAGFSGLNCELDGERCFAEACGDKGKCYDLEGGLGYRCSCPVGKTGDRCERGIVIQDPSFNRTSYIAYETLSDALMETQIHMKIKPTSVEDALLFYSAFSEDGNGDYIAITIKDRHVEFRYDSGSGPAIIRSTNPLRLNAWTNIRAERNLQDGSLSINEEVAVKGVSPGSTVGLNLRTPLYIGGVSRSTRVAPSVEVDFHQGFQGCISQILIKNVALDLINDAISSNNVADCGDARPCARRPCRNGGICEKVGSRDYRCICSPDYTGRDCEVEINVCVTEQPCRNGADCVVDEYGDALCHCKLGFIGQFCEQRISITTGAYYFGDGWIELPKELLPHRSATVEEVIEITVSTSEPYGLIFWHGQQPEVSGRGKDFLSLAVLDGKVVFSYELGSGIANISTVERIDDGRPHTIKASRTGKSGSLEVNGFSFVRGESQGILKMLNTEGNIYIGGVPDAELMTNGRFIRPFVGCISNLQIQGKGPLDYSFESIDARNVDSCT